MAWGDPTSLKFDVAKISEMRKKIQDTATELEDFKTSLLQEVETLKTNWKTPAGKKFTESVDTDWAKQVEKYVTIIGAVDELLDVAEKTYQVVEDEVNKLTF